MADYIPSTDADFNVWQFNLIEFIVANATAWGIPPEDVASLQSSQARWAAAYDKASNKQNRTAADVQTKKDSKSSFTKDIRDMVQQWLARNSKVTDTDRVKMGIAVRTSSHTTIGVPDSYPVAEVNFSMRLQHKLTFYDQATAHSNAKPEGVTGCEIYVKIDGETPESVDEMHFLGTCTSSPYIAKFEAAHKGKTAYYWLRWVNRKGETGPWSTVVSAMIVG